MPSERERESLGDVPKEAAETLLQRGSHGDAIENHEHIAGLWSAFLGVEIEAREVAEMMVLLKLSRARCGEPVKDHYVDVSGYAAIAEFIARHETAERDAEAILEAVTERLEESNGE